MITNLLKGSERKFDIKMQPIGDVHLKDCILKISVFANQNNIIAIDTSNVINIDDDTVKVVLVKEVMEKLKSNKVKFRIEIRIPDSDFPDLYKDQTYDIISY